MTCIGGTLPQNIFVDFQLSRKLFDKHWWDLNTFFGEFQPSRIIIDMHLWDLDATSFRRFSAIKNTFEMHWWDLNTKSFRRFSAIKNIYWHALGWPEHKIVSANFSYQEHLLTCIGGTLTQNLFGNFHLSKLHTDMNWWDFTKKSFRWIQAIKNANYHALVRNFKKNHFGDFQLSTEYLFTCIVGTKTQNLFGEFQLSRMNIDMHWWDFTTKSFRRFSAIKNTYEHALMGLYHKIF